MNATLHQIAEKIPVIGSYLQQPGVTYIDPGTGAQTGQQELTVNNLQALEDIEAASRYFGLGGLAGAVEAKVHESRARGENEAFQPVQYRGQGAIAVRRVVEDGAEQSVNKSDDTLEPQLPPELSKRLYALNKAATPRHIGKTAFDDEMSSMVAIYRQEEAAKTIEKGTGWNLDSYQAFKDTDPNRSGDTQVRRGPLVKL